MVDPLAITLATRSIAYLVSSAIGIRELASKVKANKEQSQLLARRIVHIAQLLELLERTRALVQIPNLDQVLEDLVDTVSRAEDLIKGLADTKSWYKKLLKTGSFKNSFADINTRLSSTLALLNASVSLHQALTSAQAGAASASTEPTASEKSLFDSDAPLISYEELEEEFDQEADAAAEEADLGSLRDLMETIITLQTEDRKVLNSIYDQQEELHKKTVASLKDYFASTVATPTAPKPDKYQHLEIPFWQLCFEEQIGRGGFGTVYRGVYQGESVAIKQLDVDRLGAVALKEFKNEIDVLSRITSRYIPRLYGICSEHGRYCIVMEYMPRGNLSEVLRDSDTELPWFLRYRMALESAKAMQLLYANGIQHRDFKSLNVLLDDYLHCKVSDFGLSKSRTIQTTTQFGTGNSSGIGAGVATLAWMAPERLKIGARFNEKCDVYSFGVTMYEIAARALPFEGEDPYVLRMSILEGVRPEIPDETPPEFRCLMEICWAQDPIVRPGFNEIVRQLEILASHTPATTVASDPAALPSIAAAAPLDGKTSDSAYMTDSPRADPFQFPGDAPPSTAAFPPPHAPFGFHTSGPSFGNGPHALGPRFGDGFPARGPLVPGAQFSPGPSHFQPQPGAGPFAPHAHPHAPPGPFQPFAAPQPQWASAPSPFTGPPPSDHGSASSSVDSHFESRGKAQFESRGPILRFGPREPRRSSRDDDKLTRRSRTREPVAPPDYADPDDMPLPPVPVRSRTPDPVRASHPAGDGYRPRDSGGLVIYGGTSANKTVLKVVQKPPSEKDKNKKGGFMGTITKFFGIGNSDSSPSQLMPAKPPRPSQPSPSPPSPMSPPPPPPPVPAVPLDASTRQHTPPSAKSAASSRTSRSSNPPQSFSKRVEAMAANLTDVLDGRVEQIDQKARQFDQAMQHFDSTGDTTPVREALEPVVRALKALSPSTAAAAADPAADATGSASSASRSVSSDSSESDEDFEDLEIDEGGMDPERVAAHKARIKELNDGMRKAKRDARTIKRESRKHSLDERERSRVAKQEATLRDREAQLEARLWQRKQQLEAQLRQRDAAHQQSAAHAAQAAAMAAHGAAGISEIHSAAIAEQHAAAMAEQGVAMAAMTSAAAAEGYDRARNMSVDSSGDSFEPLPPLFPTVARPRVLPPSQARETVVDFFPNVPESDMSPNDLNPDLLRVTVGLKLELLDTTLADYEHGYMRASYRGSDSGISGLVPLQALRANHVEVQSPFTDGHRVLQTHPAPIIAHTLGTGDGPEADSPIFIVATDLSIQRLDLPATTLNEDGSIFVPSRTMSIMSQTLHVKEMTDLLEGWNNTSRFAMGYIPTTGLLYLVGGGRSGRHQMTVVDPARDWVGSAECVYPGWTNHALVHAAGGLYCGSGGTTNRRFAYFDPRQGSWDKLSKWEVGASFNLRPQLLYDASSQRVIKFTVGGDARAALAGAEVYDVRAAAWLPLSDSMPGMTGPGADGPALLNRHTLRGVGMMHHWRQRRDPASGRWDSLFALEWAAGLRSSGTVPADAPQGMTVWDTKSDKVLHHGGVSSGPFPSAVPYLCGHHPRAGLVSVLRLSDGSTKFKYIRSGVPVVIDDLLP